MSGEGSPAFRLTCALCRSCDRGTRASEGSWTRKDTNLVLLVCALSAAAIASIWAEAFGRACTALLVVVELLVWHTISQTGRLRYLSSLHSSLCFWFFDNLLQIIWEVFPQIWMSFHKSCNISQIFQFLALPSLGIFPCTYFPVKCVFQ